MGKSSRILKPEEVQIFEDGKPQKITHFFLQRHRIRGRGGPGKAAKNDKNAPPTPPVALKPEQVRRTMAIVVDDLGLSFESTHFVRQALKKFVDEQMQPGDLVAIISHQRRHGALQQFTTDKRQLYAAIERVSGTRVAGARGGIRPD